MVVSYSGGYNTTPNIESQINQEWAQNFEYRRSETHPREFILDWKNGYNNNSNNKCSVVILKYKDSTDRIKYFIFTLPMNENTEQNIREKTKSQLNPQGYPFVFQIPMRARNGRTGYLHLENFLCGLIPGKISKNQLTLFKRIVKTIEELSELRILDNSSLIGNPRAMKENFYPDSGLPYFEQLQKIQEMVPHLLPKPKIPTRSSFRTFR